MQPVDFTTLTAVCSELRSLWLPARLEQVYQRDRHTIVTSLRTLKGRGWLEISCHPQAARLCAGNPPPRVPDTFTFSQQLRHQLGGLALVAIESIASWERILDLQFARRPGDPILWHLYVEVMGKRSNIILCNQENLIVTAAHQVNEQQSSVRPILTGQPYELPPALTDTIPSLDEAFERWKERITLIPGPVVRQLLKNYRGLSSSLVREMCNAAGIDPETPTNQLREEKYEQLVGFWQKWLQALEQKEFQPVMTEQGYSVLGWVEGKSFASVNELLNEYYTGQLNLQEFKQLRHQLSQKLSNLLQKLHVKANGFKQRLEQAADADKHRQDADLLMANLQVWQPGMKEIILPDFETGLPVKIAVEPDKNAVQNAQALYRRHQKLKRARLAVEPLLAEVQAEIDYLEQVDSALAAIETYQEATDLQALEEIRDELISGGYLEATQYRSPTQTQGADFYRYQSPGGFELLIGRNNRQNDQLSFRLAGDYDLWFHTQEIAGSHTLLRVTPGAVADQADLQFAADMTAYYSKGRLSEQVPVVYTEPKFVYKPKGAKPGMVVYKHERIVWGRPQKGLQYLSQLAEKTNQVL
ncbi:NFACT family protein [Ancylothrix sp. C2]|uniref:Rqc2 family fibronectin-binding protein n=1 Tax=Ancylothrix sp. D3o TaxID=2953691 RepID=UPI0021BB2060|nr:NFACT family protein [Ancylothrix sp. D3o]MCT7948834.1 NFACT family protein [Ancylothrix sp. D3o]